MEEEDCLKDNAEIYRTDIKELVKRKECHKDMWKDMKGYCISQALLKIAVNKYGYSESIYCSL